MWLFRRDDTLDEGGDDCEFVLEGEGGAGAKYLVSGKKGRKRGRRRRWGLLVEGGGLNMSRIVSGRLGGGASG